MLSIYSWWCCRFRSSAEEIKKDPFPSKRSFWMWSFFRTIEQKMATQYRVFTWWRWEMENIFLYYIELLKIICFCRRNKKKMFLLKNSLELFFVFYNFNPFKMIFNPFKICKICKSKFFSLNIFRQGWKTEIIQSTFSLSKFQQNYTVCDKENFLFKFSDHF